MSVYLVTGASSDLGMCFLQNLDREQNIKRETSIVYGTYFSGKDVLDKFLQNLKWIKFISVRCDLGNKEDIESLLSLIAANGHEVTHFLHLAAQKFEHIRIKEFDWDKVKRELDIQVGAFAQICKILLPAMAKQKYGKVVAVLSAYTFGAPPKYMSNYVLGKYALLGYLRAAASEYAGRGITINAVSPGMMETKFLSNLDSRFVEMNAKSSAMHRNIELKEAVGAIKYLLSDDSSYVNGINLNVTGGDYM